MYAWYQHYNLYHHHYAMLVFSNCARFAFLISRFYSHRLLTTCSPAAVAEFLIASARLLCVNAKLLPLRPLSMDFQVVCLWLFTVCVCFSFLVIFSKYLYVWGSSSLLQFFLFCFVFVVIFNKYLMLTIFFLASFILWIFLFGHCSYEYWSVL